MDKQQMDEWKTQKRKNNKGQQGHGQQNKFYKPMNNLNLQDNNFEKQQVEKSGIDLTLPQPPIPLIKWIKQVHVMVIRKLKINRARWQNNPRYWLNAPKLHEPPDNSFLLLVVYEVMGGKVDRIKEKPTKLKDRKTKGRNLSHALWDPYECSDDGH